MRKTNTEPVSDILKRFVTAYRLEHPLGCARIMNHWDEVVGSMIASQTIELNIHQRKLYVKLKSSVVRHELMMVKSRLLVQLNDLAGIKAIDDIILM